MDETLYHGKIFKNYFTESDNWSLAVQKFCLGVKLLIYRTKSNDCTIKYLET